MKKLAVQLITELTSLTDIIPAGFKGFFAKSSGLFWKNSDGTEKQIATVDHNHTLASLSEKSYNSLTDKPSIPSALSQLSEDLTHKHITEAEKSNIPKNAALIQDFSQSNITIDFTSYDIIEDHNFDSNTAITTGNKTITISNPFLNKVVTVLLPKLTEGTVIILPEGCRKLTGDYSNVLQNIIMIHCIGTSPARYLYTISQIQV